MMFHTFEVRIVQAIEKRSPGWLPNYPLYRYPFFYFERRYLVQSIISCIHIIHIGAFVYKVYNKASSNNPVFHRDIDACSFHDPIIEAFGTGRVEDYPGCFMEPTPPKTNG